MFDRRSHEYSIFGNKLDESELPSRDVASVNQSLEAKLEALSAEALSPPDVSEGLIWEDLSAEIEEKLLKATKRSKRDTR